MTNSTRLPSRSLPIAAARRIGVAWMTPWTVVPRESGWARVFLARGGFFPHPLTIQNLLWILCFVGIGGAGVRWRVATQMELPARVTVRGATLIRCGCGAVKRKGGECRYCDRSGARSGTSGRRGS